MADDVERRPMAFQEFGVRFVHAALTPGRLEARLSGMIGPLPEVPIPYAVGGVAGDGTVNASLVSVAVADLTPNELALTAKYDVRLGIHMHIAVNLFNAVPKWEGDFTVPIEMSVTAFTPLELEIGYRAVVPGDIESGLTTTNFLANFPGATGIVQSQALEKLAKKVNEAMDAALATRRIDIAKTLAALDAPEDPTAKPDPATSVVKPVSFDPGEPTVLLPGEKFEGTVPNDRRAWFQVNVDPETETHLTVAARVAEPTTMGALLKWKMVDPDNVVLDGGSSKAIYDSQDFEAVDIEFYSADRKGVAFIVVETEFNPIALRGKLSFAKRATS